jgi:hypothetical protein
MFIATLILILSTGLFFFFLEKHCQEILRRQSAQAFWQAIAGTNLLESPSVRKALEELGVPMEYRPLTDLVIKAANVNQRYTFKERLLLLYLRLVFTSAVARHWLGFGKRRPPRS